VSADRRNAPDERRPWPLLPLHAGGGPAANTVELGGLVVRALPVAACSSVSGPTSPRHPRQAHSGSIGVGRDWQRRTAHARPTSQQPCQHQWVDRNRPTDRHQGMIRIRQAVAASPVTASDAGHLCNVSRAKKKPDTSYGPRLCRGGWIGSERTRVKEMLSLLLRTSRSERLDAGRVPPHDTRQKMACGRTGPGALIAVHDWPPHVVSPQRTSQGAGPLAMRPVTVWLLLGPGLSHNDVRFSSSQSQGISSRRGGRVRPCPRLDVSALDQLLIGRTARAGASCHLQESDAAPPDRRHLCAVHCTNPAE